jgi:hypothetical protein
MLMQIFTHTPVYVWVILALLVFRGIVASADRDMAFGKLLIIPLVMPLLSLQDISTRFDGGSVRFAFWAMAALLTAVLVWKISPTRLSAGTQPGKVLVRGSWIPLAAMMAVFVTKYVAIVMLAINPHLRTDTLFIAAACGLFGIFNGIFFGRLMRDTTTWLQLRDLSFREAKLF